MREVINVAATMAMATNRQAMLDEATVRKAYSGHSALAGQQAVRFVEAGFTGQHDGIGYSYGTVIADGFDPQRMVAGLGSDWLIMQGYFKLHPAGRYSHAAIDALQAALAGVPGRRLDAADISRIDVKAFQMAGVARGKAHYDELRRQVFDPVRAGDHHRSRQIGHRLLRHRCSQQPRGAGIDGESRRRRGARVYRRISGPADLRSHDPSSRRDVRFGGRCDVMKGEPANPHAPADVERKFFDLMVPVWGPGPAHKLYASLLQAESIADFREFSRQFRC
jgi:hypothetical protein